MLPKTKPDKDNMTKELYLLEQYSYQNFFDPELINTIKWSIPVRYNYGQNFVLVFFIIIKAKKDA